MDDKGTTVTAIFGALPFSNIDDSARAISSSLGLSRELKKIEIDVNIGISTGKVYTGVIGTQGGRRQTLLLGYSVVLAFRLMEVACKNLRHDVFVDKKTYLESSNYSKCVFHSNIEVKGEENEMFYPANKYSPLDYALEGAKYTSLEEKEAYADIDYTKDLVESVQDI
jgi:class 3 adenylate cyclase